MYVIQNGAVVLLPNGAPVPPESTRIEPPDGFEDDPARFRLDGERIVERTPEQIRERRVRTKLTNEDVERLKAALEEGRI